jgi:predicted negative regulator of RcsB-dependent stress response
VQFPYNPLKCVVKLEEFTLTEYMTEEEQIEQLKNWIKQYGLSVLAGAALAVVLVTCWHYWEKYQQRQLTHASGIYDEMLTARAQNTPTSVSDAQTQAEKLLTHYPKTPYAQLAAFMLARDEVLQQHYPEALKQLNWVIDHGKSTAMRDIARLRSARIFITQGKSSEALEILKDINDKSFMGLADEIKGDAYLAASKPADAQKHYQLALQELPKAEVAERPLLQMKLDNIAVIGNTTT